tara:strand:- start:958 stop:1479 length:522 start_codon:yes stop_codon:yes gene_type:complete
MQRIIAGDYKGRTVSSMPGNDTRPTQARVRKSMLQILEPLRNKKVLDLFSGSGVLGIEALSRGASSLISIEKNKKIFSFLHDNLNKICTDSCFNAICMDAFDYLERCKEKFDIIICDPPYNEYDYMKIFNLSSRILSKNGIFCMEMRKNKINTDIFRVKTYGSTQIILWRKDD